MFDAHLHSFYSDGSLPVGALVAMVKRRTITGFSLTDHNGLWGIAEAAREAQVHGLTFVPGIEISALEGDIAIHILGYARQFNEEIMTVGLEPIRVGYEGRIRAMAKKCQQAGYPLVIFEKIMERRAARQPNPVLISTDIAHELCSLYHLGVQQARSLTVAGGDCYVPYGEWAPTIPAVVDLLHRSGGLACLAHPGLIALDVNEERMWEILEAGVKAGLQGIEVYHPAHAQGLINRLEIFCQKHHLLVTGGSDWHGPGQGWNTLGRSGMSDQQTQIFFEALDRV